MNQEFLDLYNRELKILYRRAKDFGSEHPGIADRLGELTDKSIDPVITGLLQGTAFLAARVQLKMRHEYPEFARNYLNQIVPDYLAPTPSVMLARVTPPFSDPELRGGITIERSQYLECAFSERSRRVSCRYRLCSDITLWPFEITDAEYINTDSGLFALGLPADPDIQSGLCVSLTHRTAANREDEMSDEEAHGEPDALFSSCRTSELPFYIVANDETDDDAITLYEQIFAHVKSVYFRYLDEFGTPVIVPAEPDCLRQIGFEESDRLYPRDKRVFSGFDMLREFYMFPQKFLGFRLTGLERVISKLAAKSIEIIITFDDISPRLPAAVKPSMFSLYSAPAINLFEMTADQIPVKSNQHEYQVIPDKSHVLEFEPHRIVEVQAHFPRKKEKAPVLPLYSAPLFDHSSDNTFFYTIRRLQRRMSKSEREWKRQTKDNREYLGTDMYLSLSEAPGTEDTESIRALSVRVLCSNRHLTENLPVGKGGVDFSVPENRNLEVACVNKPTKPRGPVVEAIRTQTESTFSGEVTWRLISLLSLNPMGLCARGGGAGGESLQEILTLFADLSDSKTVARIRGIRKVDTKPVVRRVRRANGIGVARGLEITITMSEKAFSGSGMFLLGAVLDRFFAEYASINSFTQVVVESVERGPIKRWPPRPGLGEIL